MTGRALCVTTRKGLAVTVCAKAGSWFHSIILAEQFKPQMNTDRRRLQKKPGVLQIAEFGGVHTSLVSIFICVHLWFSFLQPPDLG